MNNKVGTDQAVGYTAWHADTGRERLQQGFDVIVCNVRPHLSLRLGAAAALQPLIGGFIRPAGVQPAGLVTLPPLEAVLQRRASARVAVLSVRVARGGRRDLYVAVLFSFITQSRAAVRVAGPVALRGGVEKGR